MKLKTGLMIRELVGKYVVIPVGAGSEAFHGIIEMNKTGAFLWEQMEKDMTKEQLTEALLEHYDVDQMQAEKDVEIFTERLLKAGILEE